MIDHWEDSHIKPLDTMSGNQLRAVAIIRSLWWLAFTACFIMHAPAASQVPQPQGQLPPAVNETVARIRVYQVDKQASDFPDGEDFSCPEAAYATIARVLASGEMGLWRRISVSSLSGALPSADAKKVEVKPERAKMWLNARIKEVRIFQGTHAVVLAEFIDPCEGVRISARSMGFEQGKWLNAGHGIFNDAVTARSGFARACADRLPRPKRGPVANPKEYLAPFVQFLSTDGDDPKSFALKALKSHRLTIMGEIHHRLRYWAFNASLIKDPAFAEFAGTIYMELPMNDQGLINDFLAADKLDATAVVQTLRDNLWMGWPDQAMLDFFAAVWQTNRQLPPEKRLRIVLVDAEMPWKEIIRTGQWKHYDADRDHLMAENILKDIREHPDDRRSGLFIVGVGHAMRNMEYLPGEPVASAAWYLTQALGNEAVYAFFPHGPRQTNYGQVEGRLCLGLFDAAFAAFGKKPVGFPLDDGPFGRQPFDALPDNPLQGSYSNGYDGYLYLGPLENEIFSPIIPGFYTEEFVNEIEQRYKALYGMGWAEAYKKPLNAASFTSWMSKGWGRRMWSVDKLGPPHAWHYGSDWRGRLAPRAWLALHFKNYLLLKIAAAVLFPLLCLLLAGTIRAQAISRKAKTGK